MGLEQQQVNFFLGLDTPSVDLTQPEPASRLSYNNLSLPSLNGGSATTIANMRTPSVTSGSPSSVSSGRMSDAQFQQQMMAMAVKLDNAPLPTGVQNNGVKAAQIVKQIADMTSTAGEGMQYGAKLLSKLPGQLGSGAMSSAGRVAGGAAGVVAGPLAIWGEISMIQNGYMPDTKKGIAVHTAVNAASAAAVPLAIAASVNGALTMVPALATNIVAGAALNSLQALMFGPVGIAIAVGLFATSMIMSYMRARDFKKMSDTAAIDMANVGAQYVSNSGEKNLDPKFHKINEIFNGGLKAMGIDPSDMGTDSKRFTAAQRMQIRTVIAQKYGIPEAATSINDLKELAVEAVKQAPAHQKQEVFDRFKDMMTKVIEPVIGNPFRQVEERDKNGQVKLKDGKPVMMMDRGKMMKDSSTISQWDWFMTGLEDMVKNNNLGVQFTGQYKVGNQHTNKH